MIIITVKLFFTGLDGPALPLIEEPVEDFPPPPPPLPNGDSGKKNTSLCLINFS